MSFKTITARELPLTLPEMRAHLKLDDPDQVNPLDALIKARAGAACDFAQHYADRAIGLQMVEAAFPCFPLLALGLPLSPVKVVSSVKYTDDGGTVQTCASGSYDVNDYGRKHSLVPAYGTTWPTARDAWDAVKVRYTCGYEAADLPDAVRSALLLILGHLHRNNQAVSALRLDEVPMGAVDLLDTVKLWSF
ncbi:MAG: hypothetical protein JWP29_1089 [Rhodoferax sp.]|nr:hypothetical protein [Rhodoferax sp.]